MATATTANLWRSSYAIDRSRIAVFAPVRAFISSLVVLGVGTALGVTELAISVAIGALFTGILDLGEPYPLRARAMLWATVWLSAATLVGTFASRNVAVHILVAAVVAAAAGFAGSLGLHGGVTGLVSLVIFAIYSGTPVPSSGTGLRDAAAVAAGGLLATALAICAWPLGRFGGTRASVAAAYRTLGLAWIPGSGVLTTSPAVADAVIRAADLVERSKLSGDAGRWLQDLVAQAERIRLTLVAMSPHIDRPGLTSAKTHPAGDTAGRLPSTDPHMRALVAASSELTMAISRAIAWGPSRRRVAAAAASLAQEFAALPPVDDDRQRRLTAALVDQLLAVAASVEQPWPRAQYGMAADAVVPLSLRARIATHLHWGDLFVGHAIRLSVAFVIAVGLAAAIDRPHAYWIPMTVAWLAKPDLAGTVTRVPTRVLGTVTGVVVVTVVVFPLAIHWWFILWAGIGAAVLLAFLWANYAVAVAGITTFVLAAFALTGSDERANALERIVYTVIGALVVFAVALIRPRRSGRQIETLLADTCAAMSAYATSIQAGDADAELRARVLKARSAAAAALAAAAVEPSWQPSPSQLDPAVARELLGDLVEATAGLLTEELLTDEGIEDPTIWQEFTAEISQLETRLREFGGEPVDVPVGADLVVHSVSEHPITSPVRRANTRLRSR